MTSKSSVASFFELPSNIDEKTTFKARCKECGTEITGHGKTTSSFVKHVKRKHEDLLNKCTAEQAKKTSSQPSIASFCKTSAVAPKYNPSDPRQAEITDALIMFVSQDLMPLSIVESEPFRQLLFTLDPRYHLPDRKKLSRELLRDKCQSVINQIKGQMKEAKSICLTIDLWSNRQMRSYIGITAHFILNWTLKSAALACKRFRGSHTGINIYNQYLDVMNTYEVGEHITHITTDSASNMLKAFQGPSEQCNLSLPGYQQDAVPSTNDSDSESDPDDFDVEYGPLSDSESLDCPSNKSGNDPSVDSDDPMAFLPKHDSCFTHTLQNTIKDGFKAVGPISNVISRASAIVAYVRKSTQASDLLEKYPRLQTANVTRWNSQLKMIRSILAIPSFDLNKIDSSQKLSQYDRTVLTDLVEILSPFEEATDRLQGQNVVTSSLVLPVIRGLRATVNSLESKYNCGLLVALKSSLEKRLTVYEENQLFFLASVLDPRYKLDWCLSPKERDSITEILNSKAAEKVPHASHAVNTSAPSVPKRSRSKLFSFMDSAAADVSCNQVPPPISLVSNEVTNYLATPTIPEEENPLCFWKQNQCIYPTLAKLAVYHLSIPASSAPVERLFSIAGKIFRPERCRLTDQIFENLMLIRCNASK